MKNSKIKKEIKCLIKQRVKMQHELVQDFIELAKCIIIVEEELKEKAGNPLQHPCSLP